MSQTSEKLRPVSAGREKSKSKQKLSGLFHSSGAAGAFSSSTNRSRSPSPRGVPGTNDGGKDGAGAGGEGGTGGGGGGKGWSAIGQQHGLGTPGKKIAPMSVFTPPTATKHQGRGEMVVGRY